MRLGLLALICVCQIHAFCGESEFAEMYKVFLKKSLGTFGLHMGNGIPAGLVGFNF